MHMKHIDILTLTVHFICLCQMMSYSRGICHMPKSFVIWHMPLSDNVISSVEYTYKICLHLPKAYVIWQMTLAYDICLWNMTSSDKGIYHMTYAFGIWQRIFLPRFSFCPLRVCTQPASRRASIQKPKATTNLRSLCGGVFWVWSVKL